MNYYFLYVVAILLLVLGLILWRRSKQYKTMQSMRTVSMILITIGVLGTIIVGISLIMLMLFI